MHVGVPTQKNLINSFVWNTNMDAMAFVELVTGD
jgi:hypothetical protein